MVFYAAFNIISVISWQQLTLFMLPWVSPVLGWALKCLAQVHSHGKTSSQEVFTEKKKGEYDGKEASTFGHRHLSFYHTILTFNPLPDDKILGLPKLKAFADDKLNVTQNVKVVSHRIENIMGKRRKCCYQHFLIFLQCFQKAFSFSASKVVIVW